MPNGTPRSDHNNGFQVGSKYHPQRSLANATITSRTNLVDTEKTASNSPDTKLRQQDVVPISVHPDWRKRYPATWANPDSKASYEARQEARKKAAENPRKKARKLALDVVKKQKIQEVNEQEREYARKQARDIARVDAAKEELARKEARKEARKGATNVGSKLSSKEVINDTTEECSRVKTGERSIVISPKLPPEISENISTQVDQHKGENREVVGMSAGESSLVQPKCGVLVLANAVKRISGVEPDSSSKGSEHPSVENTGKKGTEENAISGDSTESKIPSPSHVVSNEMVVQESKTHSNTEPSDEPTNNVKASLSSSSEYIGTSAEKVKIESQENVILSQKEHTLIALSQDINPRHYGTSRKKGIIIEISDNDDDEATSQNSPTSSNNRTSSQKENGKSATPEESTSAPEQSGAQMSPGSPNSNTQSVFSDSLQSLFVDSEAPEELNSLMDAAIAETPQSKENCQYSCTVCGDEFASPITLITHLSSHIGGTSYPCPVCCKEFDDPSPLIVHLSQHMQGDTSVIEKL